MAKVLLHVTEVLSENFLGQVMEVTVTPHVLLVLLLLIKFMYPD
jgi:hypothetical protein